MKFRRIPAIIIAITLSIVTSKMVYFGYNSSYTRLVFSPKSFDFALSHDVYKYRILSKYLLAQLDNWLGPDYQETQTSRWVYRHNRKGTEHLYYAFFYFNTFFLVLTSIILVLLLGAARAFLLSDAEKYLLLFLTIIVINLSQYAVSPYDISGYFFQLLTLYIFLIGIDRKYLITITILGILTVIATLSRESSALSVAILAQLFYQKWGLSKKSIVGMGVLTVSFLATYIALRYAITDLTHIKLTNNMAGDFTNHLNITGLLFWALLGCLPFILSYSRENRWMLLAFHILSLPYIITCLVNGVHWEVRLYIPLFLGTMLLGKLNTAGFKIHLTTLYITMKKGMKRQFPTREPIL